MCNAWNHPPECSCGWGGDGHLGRRTTGDAASNNLWLSHLQYTGSSSYTNRNASCPICGEQVFFYQSPNGGRVFFDDLGPPWPKHPCTDNPKIKIPAPTYKFEAEASRTFAWQLNGWVPFIVKSLIPQPPQFKLFNIRGEANSEEVSLYTTVKGLNEKAPFLIKRLDARSYEVSTVQFPQFSAVSQELKFFGFIYAIDASKKPSKNSSTNLATRIKPSRPTRTVLNRSVPHKQSKPNSIRRAAEPMNALQLALLSSGLKK